jgi:hypothetical protein
VPLKEGGELQGDMSRIPHFLGNWLTESGDAVGLTCRSHFTLPPPKKIPV